MASANDLPGRQFESYQDTGNEKSIAITMSSTPATVTTVTLPDTAKGFKLYPVTDTIQFAVNQAAAALATSTSQTIAASAFGAGGIAKGDQWEVRLLPTGSGRTLSLNSPIASTVINVEVF